MDTNDHDDRRYRVFTLCFDGDMDEDSITVSCGAHLADVVDLVQGDSTKDVIVELTLDQECHITYTIPTREGKGDKR